MIYSNYSLFSTDPTGLVQSWDLLMPSLASFDITDFGATADGASLSTSALRRACEACRDAGGGTVVVPPGTFVTGVFEVFGNTTLDVREGARLIASPNLDDHLVDGTGGASCGLLHARDAENVVLTGKGILDGNAAAFFIPGELHAPPEPPSPVTWQARRGVPYGTPSAEDGPIRSPGRPGNMIVLARCRNVRIEGGLTITGASYWTIHCADCEDVVIESITIANDLRHPNNDGIHVTTCRRVRIAGCDIAAGDDAVAITGFNHPGGEAQIALGLSGKEGVCEEIEVVDCLLSSRSSAVRIGYGKNPVRGVSLRGLRIRESNRGLCIHARQAPVTDVSMENCRIETRLFHGNWWGRGEPIHVSTVRFGKGDPVFPIRRIVLKKIEAVGEGPVVLFAEEPGAIADVAISGVVSELRSGPLTEAWGGNLDLRPAADPELSLVAGGRAPLWAIGVEGLTMEGCVWSAKGEGLSADPVILPSYAGPA